MNLIQVPEVTSFVMLRLSHQSNFIAVSDDVYNAVLKMIELTGFTLL